MTERRQSPLIDKPAMRTARARDGAIPPGTPPLPLQLAMQQAQQTQQQHRLSSALRDDAVSVRSSHASYNSAAAHAHPQMGVCTWYVGRLSRADAEQMLSLSDEGTLLVRDSGADYALSIKWTQNGSPHWCTHVKITCHPRMLYQLCAVGSSRSI